MKKRKRIRKPTKRFIAFIIIMILLIVLGIRAIISKIKTEITSGEMETELENNKQINDNEKKKTQIDDWRLIIANSENVLPEDFKVELSNIDKERQFDSRAIKYLKTMMKDMEKDGISNVWVQSAYRSREKQQQLYENSINKYLNQGKSQKEAERLTTEYINRPGSSDHNLGLAVDFNYVDDNFEDTKAFKWLKQNAEKYGFILRYPKSKEDITKISYEPWHWRYVGEENAKKINELDMCLEEYIEYLNK